MSATAATATATAIATPVHMMTRHERMSSIKECEKELAASEENVGRCHKYIHRIAHQIHRQQEKIAYYRSKDPEHPKIDELQRRIPVNQESLGYWELHLSDDQKKYDQLRLRLQELQLEIGAAEDHEEKTIGVVEAAPLRLFVRLLSGDLQTIEVDRGLPISSFADHYAQTHGYAPSAVQRMVFLLPKEENKDKDESESESESENIFWSPEVRHEGISVGDRVHEGDLLCLLIRPLEDSEWKDRLSVIRQFLEKGGLYDNVTDEDIFSLYSTWSLTWTPPPKSNRYLRTKAFVEAHPDVFRPMEEEEKAASAHRKVLHTYHSWLTCYDKKRQYIWESVDLLSRGVDITRMCYMEILILNRFVNLLPHGTLPTRERFRELTSRIVTSQGMMGMINMWHCLLCFWTIPELKEMGLTEALTPEAYRELVAHWDTLSLEIAAL